MTYIPPKELLQGLSVQTAELYGKPHIGAYYAWDSVKSHKAEEGARCVICGRRATNVHHVAPLSRGHYLTLHGKQLKTCLFAVCGTGTTGCHGKFHDGTYRAEWEWFDDDYKRKWWEGEFDLAPNALGLFYLGRYIITDTKNGLEFKL